MEPSQPFDLVGKTPNVVGVGLIALDIVVSDRDTGDVRLWAGGTCGNVLTILSYLGWNAYPVARLNGDAASKVVAKDLENWGVFQDFASLQPSTSTPIIVHRISQNSTGTAYHRFSRKCPECGAWLPSYRPVRASSMTDIPSRIGHPEVYFFDRPSRGAITLARQLAERGSIVFFEPAAVGQPSLTEEAIRVCHVLKYSAERAIQLGDLASTPGPRLIIESRGHQGLRYRFGTTAHQTRGWQHVDAYEISGVMDTAGAGDWLTSGILHTVGQRGFEGLESLTEGHLYQALRFGQALAAWNCLYEGARGGMYSVDVGTFRADVKAIMDGLSLSPAAAKLKSGFTANKVHSVCPSCSSESQGVHECEA